MAHGPKAHEVETSLGLRLRQKTATVLAVPSLRSREAAVAVFRDSGSRQPHTLVIAHNGPVSMPPRHGAPHPRHCEAAKRLWQSSGTRVRGRLRDCGDLPRPSPRRIGCLGQKTATALRASQRRKGQKTAVGLAVRSLRTADRGRWQSRQDPRQSQAQAGVCQKKLCLLARRIHRSSRAEHHLATAWR
jgi:hypothetical protein